MPVAVRDGLAAQTFPPADDAVVALHLDPITIAARHPLWAAMFTLAGCVARTAYWLAAPGTGGSNSVRTNVR